MPNPSSVLEYKCPCCNAGLTFGNDVQKMTCQYCDNTFDLETVKAFNDSLNQTDADGFEWEQSASEEWSEDECDAMRGFTCPSCGGEIVSDGNTVATFCPYCDNPTIMPGRVAGGLKPEAVIPFKTSKEDAKNAFLKLCKGKPLLPKLFTEEQRVEKITGIYVPFWLYNCDSDLNGQYNATRIHRWSDATYEYTRTEHFLLHRACSAEFDGIPMDASKKMEDAIMESIEPFDYSQMVDFNTAYLSGYFADKYDVEAKEGEDRVRQRVSKSMDDMLQRTFAGYATVVPTSRQLNVKHGKAKYVLLPVWMLHTKYRDKTYVFAMNGQSGKMTGTFPICPKRTAAWFAGITAGVGALLTLLSVLF